MSYSVLGQSIYKTLCYFDIADYPLTKEELYAFLWQPPAIGYGEFLEKIAQAPVESKMSHYFLPGRSETVENRRRKFVVSDLKLNIAKKAAKKIRSVPFLKAIFVCNSVGSEQATEESDIDFLIITSPRRIWIARGFANIILRLFGLRTYGKKIKNKICLSFFVDSDHLNLCSLKAAEDDVHFVYWFQRMLPIYDPENLYSKFLSENDWAKKFTPNMRTNVIGAGERQVENSKLGAIWKKIWETMWRGAYGDLIENQAKQTQWMKIKLAMKEKAEMKDNGVVFADGVIKLHENDTRLNYRDKWEKRCDELMYAKIN
ncbi:MAG: hypothetical protein AAB348_01315 [Patescibacteria group bacterium]